MNSYGNHITRSSQPVIWNFGLQEDLERKNEEIAKLAKEKDETIADQAQRILAL